MGTKDSRARVAAIVVGLIFVLGGFACLEVVRPVVGQPTNAAGATSIAVTATSGYSFDPNTFQNVATNSTITVTLTDGSVLAHTFTIIGREGWVIPTGYSATQIYALAYLDTPRNLVNVNVSSSGDVESRTFNSTGPGWYEFVCTEAGHFTEGMYGFIAFGMALPSNLTVSSGLPGPGAALFIIIGTIVTLVVVTIILAFIFGRRKGAEHEMPPERLGYPEPSSGSEPLPTNPDEPHRR